MLAFLVAFWKVVFNFLAPSCLPAVLAAFLRSPILMVLYENQICFFSGFYYGICSIAVSMMVGFFFGGGAQCTGHIFSREAVQIYFSVQLHTCAVFLMLHNLTLTLAANNL